MFGLRIAHHTNAYRLLAWVVAVCMLGATALTLTGCQSSTGAGSAQNGANGSTEGAPFVRPALALTTFDLAAAQGPPEASIDTSSVSLGYVGASAVSTSRLKFQVKLGEVTYTYDLPNDGTPLFCPINMGDGTYTFQIMQNTSRNLYVEAAPPHHRRHCA